MNFIFQSSKGKNNLLQNGRKEYQSFSSFPFKSMNRNISIASNKKSMDRLNESLLNLNNYSTFFSSSFSSVEQKRWKSSFKGGNRREELKYQRLNTNSLKTLEWTDPITNPFASEPNHGINRENDQINYFTRYKMWKDRLQDLNVIYNPQTNLTQQQAEKKVFNEIEKKRKRAEEKLNRKLNSAELTQIESQVMERNIDLFINFRPDRYLLFRPNVPFAGSNEEEKEEFAKKPSDEELEDEDTTPVFQTPELLEYQKQNAANQFCNICANQFSLDAMNIGLIYQTMTRFGAIKSRYETMFCAKHQRRLSKLIKRAKHMGFISYKQRTFTINSAVDSDYWMDWAGDKRELSETEANRVFSTNKVVENPVDDQIDTSSVAFSITDVNLEDFRLHVEGLLKSVSSEELVWDHDKNLANLQITPSVSIALEDPYVEYIEEITDEFKSPCVDAEGNILMEPEGELSDPYTSHPFSRAILVMGEQLRIQSRNIVDEDYIPAGLPAEKAEELVKILHGIIDECMAPYETVLSEEGEVEEVVELEQGQIGKEEGEGEEGEHIASGKRSLPRRREEEDDEEEEEIDEEEEEETQQRKRTQRRTDEDDD